MSVVETESREVQISNLKVQIENYENELELLNCEPNKNDAQLNAISAIETELETAKAKLAAIKGMEQAAEIEVQESLEALNIPGTDDVISLALLINSDDIPLEDKIAVIKHHVQVKQVNAAVVNASLRSQLLDVEKKNGNLEMQLASKDDEIFKLTEENDDLQRKLSNAAAQLEEERGDKKRLGEEVEKLREQLTKSSLPTQTDLNMSSAELVQKVKDAQKPIINLRWEDEIKHVYYLAELAETGETVRFHYFNKGLYREVTAEEAETFRKEAEQAAAESQNNAIPDNTLVTDYPEVPKDLFPESATDGVDENQSIREDDAPPTRAEFEALSAEVAEIKRVIGIKAA
ncbi:hypothetical protein [Paenibacillus sp. NEAU-GSW1]|uniref:hypothetical protein n=1 Tax=Paenibacillus sp. NEAU-GSW1 TaxID=2682486 RepID=UPI0012E222E5|nr:hypothetical protein [Paenibacillus sp. NEAU-GSW1]MUT66025.1 hypothetical protein [Paenibacillus sp. NEAU-GSW1]